jgi:DNA-binding beta-propeller fold protein YncE
MRVFLGINRLELVKIGILVAVAFATAKQSRAQFAYGPGEFLGYEANGIFGYEIESSGLLSPLSNAPVYISQTNLWQESALVDSESKYLYVLEEGSLSASPIDLRSFSIEKNGLLQETAGSPFAYTSPHGVASYTLNALSPNNRFMYMIDYYQTDNGLFLQGDITSLPIQGNGSVVTAGAKSYRLGFKPFGWVFGPKNNFVIALDLQQTNLAKLVGMWIAADGHMSPIQAKELPLPKVTVTNFLGLGINPAGTFLYEFYVGTNPQQYLLSIFSVDKNGKFTEIAGSPFSPLPSGYVFSTLSITPDGRYAYVATQQYGTLTVYVFGFAIGTDGEFTPMAGSPAEISISEFSFVEPVIDRTGRFLFMSGNSFNAPRPPRQTVIYQIGSDGSLTSVSGSPQALNIYVDATAEK